MLKFTVYWYTSIQNGNRVCVVYVLIVFAMQNYTPAYTIVSIIMGKMRLFFFGPLLANWWPI